MSEDPPEYGRLPRGRPTGPMPDFSRFLPTASHLACLAHYARSPMQWEPMDPLARGVEEELEIAGALDRSDPDEPALTPKGRAFVDRVLADQDLWLGRELSESNPPPENER